MSKQRQGSRSRHISAMSFPLIAIFGIGAVAVARADSPLFLETPAAFCAYYDALKKYPAHPPADTFRTHQKKLDGTQEIACKQTI